MEFGSACFLWDSIWEIRFVVWGYMTIYKWRAFYIKSVLILLFFKNPKRPSERVLLNMLMFLNHFELQIVLTVLRIFWLVLLDGRSRGRIFPIGPLSWKALQIKPQLIKCRSINGLSFFIYLRLSIIKCSDIYCDLLSIWCLSTLVHKLLLSLWLWIWFAHNLAEVAVGAVRTGGASTVVSPLFPHHCKQHSEIIIKPINRATTS